MDNDKTIGVIAKIGAMLGVFATLLGVYNAYNAGKLNEKTADRQYTNDVIQKAASSLRSGNGDEMALALALVNGLPSSVVKTALIGEFTQSNIPDNVRMTALSMLEGRDKYIGRDEARGIVENKKAQKISKDREDEILRSHKDAILALRTVRVGFQWCKIAERDIDQLMPKPDITSETYAKNFAKIIYGQYGEIHVQRLDGEMLSKSKGTGDSIIYKTGLDKLANGAEYILASYLHDKATLVHSDVLTGEYQIVFRFCGYEYDSVDEIAKIAPL